LANHASALKAHRQSVRRRERNRNRLRTALKRVSELIKSGKADEAKAALPGLYALVDKSVQKKALSPNAARRHKSRFTLAVNAGRAGGAK
jgi:small subunit ribosomal protein S20